MKRKSILYSIIALLSFVSLSIVTYASENGTSSTVNEVVNDFENNLDVVEDDLKESLGNNISEEYLLNIPISNEDDEIVAVVRFYCYEDGSCELYSFGQAEENELAINEKLASIKNADEKKAVILNRYSLIVLYYQDNNEEYVEPITLCQLQVQ